MQHSRILLASVLASAAMPLLESQTHAAFLNFDSLPAVVQDSGTPTDPNAVLTDDFMNDGILFGKAGVSAGVVVNSITTDVFSAPNAVSGLDNNGNIPFASSGDVYFSFVGPGTLTPSSTDQVSFYIGDSGGDLDIFEVRSYDLNGNVIDTQNVQGNSFFQVTVNQPVIHRVEIDFNNNSDAGFLLDDLAFNTPRGTGVPDAASTAGLLTLALAGLLQFKRRLNR